MARTHKGLQWVRTSEAIRSFVTEHGRSAPRRAILCTYNFEAETFERFLFPELTRRGRQFSTLVLADGAALQGELSRTGQRRFDRYEIGPVRCGGGGVFHPKLVFLAAGRRHMVGIGSANLTSGGLRANLELMMFADDTTECGRQLVGGAACFLSRLIKKESIHLPASAREFIETALAGVKVDRHGLIDSLDESLLSQMVSLVLGKRGSNDRFSREVIILSPWHSALRSPEGLDPAIIRQMSGAFGGSLSIYTEGQKGCGPDLGVPVYIRGERPRKAAVDNEDSDNPHEEDVFDRRPYRVHAKAYLITSPRQGGTLFFGSANCTLPALNRTPDGGGNVEILGASRLGDAEISAFKGDLNDLFVLTQKTFGAKAPIRPETAKGIILCGRLTGGRNGVRLHIEAPNVERGSVQVGPKPDRFTVTVKIRHGWGLVSKPIEIHDLFPDVLPKRSDSAWGSVLWERSGREGIPFPVSIPLLGVGTDSPDGFLLDLASEEMGFWPAETTNGGAGAQVDDQSQDEEERDDLDALTEAQHEGELDRIAVRMSILRKRIMRSAGGPEYARSRMALLRRQIAGMDIAPHLRDVLLEYSHQRSPYTERPAR